jgi:formylglycine-generating enzyme required for sulfatase activity
MVRIPAGSFMMGNALAQSEGDGDEIPQHEVSVTAFRMDRTEVSKALWDVVWQWAINHGYDFDDAPSGKAGDHPVHSVSWYSAIKWCNARSEMENRMPAYYTSAAQTTVYRSGKINVENDWVKWAEGYRLPTEAEWEKAARGGSEGVRFPWGNEISHSLANYKSDSNFTYDVSPTKGYHTCCVTGEEPYTSPVGSFAASGYGLMDMAGNVWEWCWDVYSGTYYGSSPAFDPRGPSSLGAWRVLRGGGWYDNAFFCRISDRTGHDPSGSNRSGFRCVLPGD